MKHHWCSPSQLPRVLQLVQTQWTIWSSLAWPYPAKCGTISPHGHSTESQSDTQNHLVNPGLALLPKVDSISPHGPYRKYRICPDLLYYMLMLSSGECASDGPFHMQRVQYSKMTPFCPRLLPHTHVRPVATGYSRYNIICTTGYVWVHIHVSMGCPTGIPTPVDSNIFIPRTIHMSERVINSMVAL